MATTNSRVEDIFDNTPGEQPVRGVLHQTGTTSGDALVLTHGAGGNCNAPLLIVLAELFSAAGVSVLRCDLPFRQKRPHGPPSAGSAQQDQDGLRRAVTLLRGRAGGRIFLGGVSYGGRQSTMLAASESSLVPALLLLSYPLHPPGRSTQLRTAHFSRLRTPALFVHGTKDPFGSLEEMGSAISLIPAKTKLLPVEGAGHGLLTSRNKSKTDAVSPIVESFLSFVGTPQ